MTDALLRYARRLAEIPDDHRHIFDSDVWRERIETMDELRWRLLMAFARLSAEDQKRLVAVLRVLGYGGEKR